MPVLNHIHSYIKFKKRPGFFRCNSPDCTHFIERDAILNKLSLCTSCGNQMILTREDLRRAKPKCLDCANTKKAKAHRKAQDLTRYLGTESFPGFSSIKEFTHDDILGLEEIEEEEEIKSE